MTEVPLGQRLRADLDEARIKTMWERIDHPPPRARGPWLLAAVAALAALLLLVGLSRWSSKPEPKQLALESGTTPGVLGSEAASTATRFDDGSRLNLTSGTRLEVLRNDGRSFVTVLRRGEATFDVKAGGPRHWIVEAGELSVEVVGTRFRVERTAAATRVGVDHGIVMVRGERVPGGSVQLIAGMSFELPVAERTHALDEAVAPAPSAAALAPRIAEAAEPVAERALPVASTSAAIAMSDAVELRLKAADAARLQGDVAAAIRHFRAAFEQAAPGDARRGLAALSLARLLMNGQPAEAAKVLRSSLSDMPGALLEDAAVRLVEAESRAGNHDAAARAGADYLRRFPAGRRAEEVRRWSEP